MSHLDEGMIHALLDGEIPSAELPPVQAHLGACAECRARLAEEQDLLATSDRLIELIEVPAAGVPVTPKAISAARRTWPGKLAWAATVVLAAGVGYSARGGGPERPAELTTVPETTIVFRAAEPTPPAVTAPPAGKAVPGERATALADRSQTPGGKREQTAAEGVTARADERTRQPARDQARAQESFDRLKVPDSLPAAKSAAVANVAAAPPLMQRAESLPRLPAAPVAASGQLRGAAKRLSAESNRLEEIVVTATGQAEAKLGSPSPITLKDAVRRLGGSLRLIDGLIPERLEAIGPEVRVVYLTGFGELVLSQELTSGRLRTVLIVPPGLPSDSVERLRTRIRE